MTSLRLAALLTAPSRSFASWNGDLVEISLVSTDVVSKTEPTYASWNIDSSCNRGFHHINFTNPNLLAAARGLRPSKLRFGGSGNDNLVYGFSPGSPECSGVLPSDCGYTTPGCLNATHWANLHDFAIGSQSDLIFGVAYGLEQACNEGDQYVWNRTNAAQLLQHIRMAGQHVWGFELGNEVNNNGGAPCNQTAKQQAEAQKAFAGMVKAQLPSAVLIGPDTGYQNWQNWLETYLPLVSDSSTPAEHRLHAITHHVYSGIKRHNFNNAGDFDRRATEVDWYVQQVRKLAPYAQIWAGEDGPTAGGNDGTCGSDTACGTYGTTLWYADDLAYRAKYGFAQYQRQTLFGGYYGLTNSPTTAQALSPSEPLVLRPDYWVNFLWKRTIGTDVLNVTSSTEQVRAYAFSGRPPSSFAAKECAAAGSWQLLLINMDASQSVSVKLPEAKFIGGGSYYSAWTLSPPSEGPFSELAMLNGLQLPSIVDVSQSDPEAFLVEIPQKGVRELVSAGITIPPVSTSFVCIGGTDAAFDFLPVAI